MVAINMWMWPALLLSPTLALTNLSLTYAMVTPACENQSVSALHVVALASLLLSVIFTIMAWYQRLQLSSTLASDAAINRQLFLATTASLVGLLSSLVIAAQWVPIWVLSPCVA